MNAFLGPLYFWLSILFCALFSGVLWAHGQEEGRPVRVAPVQFAPLPVSVELVGTIRSRKESELSTQVQGLIADLEVDVGSRVEKGEVLLRLDSTLAEIRRRQTAEAIKAARAELTDAENKFKEFEALVRKGGISESELETRQAEFQVREADLARLELTLQEEMELLDQHQLTAPFTGIISDRYSQVGEWIIPGTPVLRLVETGFYYFDTQAPQRLYAEISESTRAAINLDLYPDQVYSGKVSVIVPYKDPDTRTFLVRLRVDAPEEKLLPGASGKVRFFTREENPTTFIPSDALVRQPDGSYNVWVVVAENSQTKAERRMVRIGDRAEDQVEILSGIQQGETVIIRGNENLVPAQPVKILSSENISE